MAKLTKEDRQKVPVLIVVALVVTFIEPLVDWLLMLMDRLWHT